MRKTILLHLLISFGIWSQGVIETFADEAIKESPDVHVRQKRVISRIPGEDKIVLARNVPYIVHVKYGTRIHCVASILSRYVVITVASCVGTQVSIYHIVSATSRSSRGTFHNVTGIRKHYGNHPSRPLDGIALLTVDPPFLYGRSTKNIELHSAPLLPGIHGTVSGWGHSCSGENRGTDYPRDLRSIEVPILAHRDCVNRYLPHHVVISDVDICTFHPQRSCGHNDFGAPLVVDGYLAGVYLWHGVRGQYTADYPDVFIMLQHSAYNQWIRTNVRNIDLEFHNNSH